MAYQDPRLRIRHVKIKGNKRTNTSVFDAELQEAYAAESFMDVRSGLAKAAHELAKLGIFESVDINMDSASDDPNNPLTDVTIVVKEKRWWKAHVGGSTDGYEGAVDSTFTLTNPIGDAEVVSFSGSLGYIGSNIMKAHYSRPLHFLPKTYFSASASNETVIHEKLSSYSEKYRGGTLSINDKDGVHEVAFNLGWRDVVPRRNPAIPSAFDASRSIIAEAHPSMKTSVQYTYKNDTRDHPPLPSSGSLVHINTEVAGLAGDVKFVKAELSTQKHVPFGPNLYGYPAITASFCTKLGAIKGYGSDSSRLVRISDRFFLGGPMSLRGFNHKGIGPRALPEEGGVPTGDALGGEISYSATASLGFPMPIPTLAALGFRGHMFLNGGNLTNWSLLTGSKSWKHNILFDTRAAAGVGMVISTRFGRFEANYSWVLNAKEHDRIKRGQLGIGLNFN